VNTDDVIRVITSSGGGWGDPKARDPEQVNADVKNGYLTAEQAQDIYGVTVNGG
jgi:N-methylhydantoinase B